MGLNRINADSIADGTVVASDIADGTITAAKLSSGVLPSATANSAASYANSAFTTANGAFTAANTAQTTASAAFNQANGAFDRANTKFNSSGGTISGDTVISGNLTVVGQTVYANTTTTLIADNIITLNGENEFQMELLVKSKQTNVIINYPIMIKKKEDFIVPLVSYRIQKEGFDYLDAPIRRITAADAPMHYAPNLVAAYLPDVTRTVKLIKEVMYIQK